MQKREFSIEIGGKKLTAAFSDLAERANGSVVVSCGNTSVLATAVMSEKKRDGIDFFPLVVDYEERFYAAGEILGSRFIRREGRPTDEAILGGRIVDRTIRPLFDKTIRNEVQIVITVLSIDEDDPDVLAINAASLAIAASDIPWNGPVSAVRVGKKRGDNNFIINPNYEARKKEVSELDLVACGKESPVRGSAAGEGIVNMIEVGAGEVPEGIVGDALAAASSEIGKLQKFQRDIVAEIGKEKRKLAKPKMPDKAEALFQKKIEPRLRDSVFCGPDPEFTHVDLKGEWLSLFLESFPDEDAEASWAAADYYENAVDELLHSEAIKHGRRADGRAPDELRPLFARAGGMSPVLHGSGIFYRGGTHILSILTLGGPKDAQLLDSMEVQGEKHFMHHYNFPPFSSGETGRIGGINRRAIGHGALAEKALLPVIPSQDEFPYTIRIVSEALASNGSTSMGSVCASTLALMDAGVPVKAPVAGIAMGLMMEYQKSNIKNQSDGNASRYKILTDIQGPEDHHGDMDFKVAGTRTGITAVQMDVKVLGVPVSVLKEALEKGKAAREKILDVMEKEIAAPRPELSPAAPRIITRKVPISQIGLVIGASGQTVRKIVKETGAEVDIEDDGTIYITGKNDAARKADEMIEEITHEFTPGERFEGEVVRILDFGAFVKVSPYAEGLVHVSELAPVRVERVTDVVREGDRVPVVVKEVDERGRLNLSIKQVAPDFFKEKLGVLPRQNDARRHSGRAGSLSGNRRPRNV